MIDIMGENRVARMVAFGTLQRASAWKMYARAVDVPFEIANEISEYLRKYELDVKYADDDDKNDIDVFDYVPEEYHDYVRMSEQYLGVVDSISPHSCAFVLSNADVRREFGLIRLKPKTGNKKEIYAAFIDGETADAFGYLKLDILHVDVVGVNRNVYDRIGMKLPTVKELLEMTTNDSETWRMYRDGYTMGLNQVEKEPTRQKLVQYKPKNISELSAFVAAVRPSFKSMLQIFLARRRFSYKIPVFDKLLQTREMKDSFILYQEQLMKALQYGGFAASESYAAIKAIAKKHPEQVLPMRERFLNNFAPRVMQDDSRCTEGKAKEIALKVWQIIEDATSYGFNACLSENMRIRNPSPTGKSYPTIGEMYQIATDIGYAFRTGNADLHRRYRRFGFGSALSMFEDGRVKRNEIIDIRYAGRRKTYKLTLSDDSSIVCTDNHKFPTIVGEKRADELWIGDELYVCGKTINREGDPSEHYFIPYLRKLMSIEAHGEQDVYDVEMAEPAHNFVIDSDIITSNSHAYCVALDSLYGAWAKAHHP